MRLLSYGDPYYLPRFYCGFSLAPVFLHRSQNSITLFRNVHTYIGFNGSIRYICLEINLFILIQEKIRKKGHVQEKN